MLCKASVCMASCAVLDSVSCYSKSQQRSYFWTDIQWASCVVSLCRDLLIREMHFGFWNFRESARVGSAMWCCVYSDDVSSVSLIESRGAYLCCSASSSIWFHMRLPPRNEALLLSCQHMFFCYGPKQCRPDWETDEERGKKRQWGREDLDGLPAAEINNILFSSVLDISVPPQKNLSECVPSWTLWSWPGV